MKIIVNGLNLTTEATGIANVIINVINELSKKNKVIILSNKPILEQNKNRINNYNVSYQVSKLRFCNRAILWFFIKFPYIINKSNCDYLWAPAVWVPFFIRKRVKKIVTINDFVSHDYKKTMKFFNWFISSIVTNYSIKNADYLWCISDYTKNLLLQYYPKRKCNDIFVGCAPDPFIKKISNPEVLEETKKQLNLPDNYILFVGSLEPRKNLKFLLQVFKEYVKNNSSLHLVIVGAKGWGKTDIAEIINSNNYPKEYVLFTGFISEEQLRAVYNLASIYVSTSLNEGFGLPQVEAMNCDIPVISPHNSAMIEVVDGAGVTVKTWNIEDWCNAIDNVIENRETIIKQQNIRREVYKWENIITKFYDYIK